MDRFYMPQQQWKQAEISQRGSTKLHSSTVSKKKKKVNLLQNVTVIPNKALAFIPRSTFRCLSCGQRGWNLLKRTFTESSHLQVLLLPGEGVGEALHRLRFVFCYFWLDGLCYFLNHRINLFQKTMGLIDLVHLSRQEEKQLNLIGFWLSVSEGELFVRNEPSVK